MGPRWGTSSHPSGVASGCELWPQGTHHYLKVLHMELLPMSADIRRAEELKCSNRLVDSFSCDPKILWRKAQGALGYEPWRPGRGWYC